MSNEAYTVERESDEGDAAAGINLITMLLARGKQPDEVMASLAMAMAVFNVIVTPNEEALQSNTKNTDEFIRKAQAHMWPNRGAIEAIVGQRVARLVPFTTLLDGITGLRGGGDRPKEPAEPQHEQFKV